MADAARFESRLPEKLSQIEQRIAAGMTQALILGAGGAADLTPIHSSNLLNSQYRDVSKQGGHMVGRVGYTAEYAEPVHDPDHPQQFRRAGASKEFLLKGFERAEPKIRRTLAAALKKV